jgi:hypothetical protein
MMLSAMIVPSRVGFPHFTNSRIAGYAAFNLTRGLRTSFN